MVKFSQGRNKAQVAVSQKEEKNESNRASINAELTTGCFGGRPSLYSDNFRMVLDNTENQKSVFAVFRLVSTGRII